MIELRAYLFDGTGGQYLDLYKDEPVFLEMSFSEIQDIAKKNSAFTKSFTLPGTKNNNKFFNHFYDPTSIGITFDSRLKRPAEIMYNGYTLLTGYIRLESATKTKGEVVYSVVFYNQVGDLLSKMGDKKLNELTTDGSTGNKRLDHLWNWNNIFQSWLSGSGPGTGLLDGSILYPLLNRGYLYNTINGESTIEYRYTPLYDLSGIKINSITRSGLLDPYDYAIYDQYFSPSVRLVDLFQLILNDNGFTLESNFLTNNEWVKSIYLPTTYSTEDFGMVQIPNETWAVYQDSITISSLSNIVFNYDTIQQDEHNRWINTTDFQNGVDGFSLLEVEFDVENTGGAQTEVDVVVKLVSQSTPFDNLFTFTVAGGDRTTVKAQKWFKIFMLADFQLQFRPQSFGGTLVLSNINFRLLKSSRYGSVRGSGFPVLRMNEQLGDTLSQADVVSSVLKMFNLVIIPKINEPETLIVEPFDLWVGSGDLIDWTTKVNRDSPIQITDTTKFINSVLELTPTEGKDFLSENYKKENDFLFGKREQPLNTDYKESKKSINTKFTISQQELIKPSFDFTVPVFYQAKDENVNGENIRIYNNFKTTPTLILYCGRRSISLERSVYMNYFTPSLFQVWPTDTQFYPQSHHLTYFPINTFSQNKTIGFDKDQKQGSYKQISVDDDLYTMFYQNIITDYVSDESRFMSCELYLTDYDIKNLDFSEQIIIDNSRWRINKLSNIDLRKPGLVKGEFVKLVGEYQTPSYVGTDALILTKCDGSEYLYTTIALNPNILPYVGYIIKLATGCYYVNPPSAFDPNQTYTQITQLGFTPFNSCSDCGEPGIFCEPITFISGTYEAIPPGAILLGEYQRQEWYGFFYECETTRFYWDCATNSFIELVFVGQGQCQGTLGWDNIYGTPIQVPNPVNLPGNLIQTSCYDPITGFNYDIYTTIEPAGGPIMYLHKICSSEQPTTTTTTTESPTTTTTTTESPTTTTTTTILEYQYLVVDCRTSDPYRIRISTPLSISSIYELNIDTIGLRCVEVITTSSTYNYTALDNGKYDSCMRCLGGGSASS